MKNKLKFLKKILLFLVVFVQLFALNLHPAQAITEGEFRSAVTDAIQNFMGSGSLSGAIDNIAPDSLFEIIDESSEILEQRFNINRDSFREISTNINASVTKKTPPQVQVTFNPANPKPGEKVTATATPTYFKDQPSALYFTWYLSREGENNSAKEMKERGAKIMANGENYTDDDENSWTEDWENFIGSDDNDGYKALFGGESATTSRDADDEEYRGIGEEGKHCYAHDFKEGKSYEVECKHQFADNDLGDGDFDVDEEEEWGTNPSEADTDGDGIKDEADLCGLAQERFTWNYKPGDEVGVIVEGTSTLPTPYNDSSYMIMWALPKNSGCKVESKGTMDGLTDQFAQFSEPAAIPVTPSDQEFDQLIDEIATGKIDFDKNCLKANLVSPTEGGAFSKMDVNISYSPERPLNIEGKKLELSAFVTNVSGIDTTKFSWKFEACKDIDKDCKNIPYDDIAGVGQTVGFGLTKLSLPLGIEDIFDSRKYLKVTVRAITNIGPKASNSGVGTTYISMTDAANDLLKIYSAVKNEDGTIEKTKDENGEYYERCSDGEDPCPIIKGEIVWLEGEDGKDAYSWFIDGKTFAPENCDSGECEYIEDDGERIGSESTEIAYFSVKRDVGGTHEIKLISEVADSGEKIDILRKFEVVKPELKIKPQECAGDTPGRIMLGQYKEAVTDWCSNEEITSDYSEKNFFVAEGGEIKLQGDFSLKPIGKKLTNPVWTIDGVDVTMLDTELQAELGVTIENCQMTFTSDREVGKRHVIKYSGYYIDENSEGKTTEKHLTDKIEVKVMSVEQPKEGDNIVATIFTGFPSYVLFLFKTTILIALMLFVSRILFNLIPQIKN